MNCVANVLRYRSLTRYAEEQFAKAKTLPQGDERDELIRDAVAAHRRAHEIAGGGA